MVEPACFLNVDKPMGLSSRSVVDRVGRRVGTRRVGHAGTLDPLATGVLVIAIGKATRLVEYVQQTPKTYEARFRLGQTSDTDDREGAVLHVPVETPPGLAEVGRALEGFVGNVMQRPPAYSALKVGGKRAYALARGGMAVELEPRPVQIHSIEILGYEYPDLDLRIQCGSGTYIRSLARDLGEGLGTGGLMADLRRTAVGPFRVEEAVSLEVLEHEPWERFARPMTDGLAELPRVRLDETGVRAFRLGQVVRVDETFAVGTEVAAVSLRDCLLGIGVMGESPGVMLPRKGGFASQEGERT